MEIQRKSWRLVEIPMKRSKATIPTMEGETEEFEFNTGVIRGDDLSTTLFNMPLDAIIKGRNLKITITNFAVLVRDRNNLKETTILIEKERIGEAHT